MVVSKNQLIKIIVRLKWSGVLLKKPNTQTVCNTELYGLWGVGVLFQDNGKGLLIFWEEGEEEEGGKGEFFCIEMKWGGEEALGIHSVIGLVGITAATAINFSTYVLKQPRYD